MSLFDTPKEEKIDVNNILEKYKQSVRELTDKTVKEIEEKLGKEIEEKTRKEIESEMYKKCKDCHRLKYSFGSELNEFINKNCEHKFTMTNIDVFLLKREQSRIMVIESKHSKEREKPVQVEALKMFVGMAKALEYQQNDLIKQGKILPKRWKLDVYTVFGDAPYDEGAVIKRTSDNERFTFSKSELISFLEFKKDLDTIVKDKPF